MEGETKLKKDRTRAMRKMKRSRVRYEEKETIKKVLKRNKMTSRIQTNITNIRLLP